MEKGNSRFKYGRRRSRSLGGVLNPKEICKTLRPSLSSSQKLQLLVQYALENALAAAEKDLTEDVDDDAFRKSISNCQVNIESEIEEMNYISLAAVDKEVNEVNATLAEKYEQYSSADRRLEDETKQWNQLLEKYRSRLMEEKDVNEIHFKDHINFDKYQHLDYSAISKDIESIDSHVNYQITKLKNTSNFLKGCLKLTNKGISSWSKNAGNTFVKTFEDSPRQLIKKCF